MTEINEAGGRATGPGPDAHRERVSLADILDRRVALDWVESVAIVAGLCSVLKDMQTPGVPPPGDVVLTADGAVRVDSGRCGDDPAALPRLLHELSAIVPPPMPVRLFMLNAISSDGDKSPASFGDAIAYYERPGREELIQNARQKCLDTPLPLAGSALPQTAPELEDATAHETSSPQPRHRGRLAVACLGMCLCAAAVVVTAGQPRTNGSAHAILAKVKKAGHGVALTIQGELTSAFGNRSDAVTADDTTAVPAVTEDVKPAHTATRKPAKAASREQAAVSTDDSPQAEIAAALPAPADVNAADVNATDDTDTSAGATVETLTDLEHAGLVPPRLMDPVRLPPWVDPVNKLSMNAIELEISTSGTVKRVRMLSPALRMTDMMMLSAAKTWLFEPASMNGRPVTYLLTLGVTSNR